MIEAAEEGNGDAIEELQLDQLGAIETLVDAFEDEHKRKMILLGLMLGPIGSSGLVEGVGKDPKGGSLQ